MSDDIRAMRRKDLWTSLVLLLLAAGMAAEAMTYPITDSYGGVQNVWYVSPALFPFIVAALLAILSTVLLINAVRALGFGTLLRDRAAARGSLWTDGNIRFIAIVLLIAGYVYGFIPAVDFVAGTALFLFAFVAAFHLDDRFMLYAGVLGVVSLGVVARIWSAGEVDSAGLHARDLLTTAMVAVLLLLALWRSAGDPPARRKVWHALLVAMVVPLILAPAFRFGLLVPLPTEGLFLDLMHEVRYDLRAVL